MHEIERAHTSPVGTKLGPQSDPKSDAGFRTKFRCDGSDQTW